MYSIEEFIIAVYCCVEDELQTLTQAQHYLISQSLDVCWLLVAFAPGESITRSV